MVAPRRRASGRRALSIWANGLRVGRWTVDPRAGHVLEYDRDWAASPEGRPLSLSLPLDPGALQLRTPAVERYFDNLLPDSDAIRRRIRERFHVASGKPFELLAAIGRDCVGALQLLPEDERPEPQGAAQGEPLTDAQVATLLGRVTGGALGADEADDFRISIAGAQEKTALLRIGGQWHRPVGATATTHILKLPLGRVGNMQADLSTSVENEWLCLRLLRAYGLPAARAEIGHFVDRKALVVERFDRSVGADGQVLRLMQEDFCQALGLGATLKYERDGGPGMRQVCERLLQGANRDADLETFWQAQVLFLMLAATDGHAKNFSIRIHAGGSFTLTPVYDVLSAWPIIGPGPNQLAWQKARLAMAFRDRNAHYNPAGILRRHLLATAERDCRIPAAVAERLLDVLLARTPGAIEEVNAALPSDFPASVADSVFRGLRESALRLGA